MGADGVEKNYQNRLIKTLLADEQSLQRSIAQALQAGAFSCRECRATIKEARQLIKRLNGAGGYTNLSDFLDRVDGLLKRDD